MKIKQLALLTLSLSVSLTTATSARVDDSLMQSLQPGRRAGVVNPPPPAMKKPVEPSIPVDQANASEPVIIMPTPVSATPARSVQPAIVVPPPVAVSTIGRDGKGWVADPPKVEAPIQSEPVSLLVQATTTVDDNQVLELMDIDTAPDREEPQPIRAVQNSAPVVAMTPGSDTQNAVDTTSSNINQKVTPVASSQPVSVPPSSKVINQDHDTEQLSFTDIALDSSEPMTESTPIAPQTTAEHSATTLADTRPAIQPASGKSKSVQNDVVDTSAKPSKADQAVEKDILNWTVTDTSLAPVDTTSSADLYKSAPKLSTAGGNKASVDFIKNTVRQALVFSPEIRNAEAVSTASRYDIDEIKGKRWPQVKVGANSPISNFGGGKSVSNSTDVSDTSGSVSMTTTVYDFGKTSSGIQSAEETSKASLELEKLTRNQIAFQTISGLLELDKYQKDIKVAKLYQSRMADLVKMLSQITETDKGRGSELVQARSKLLQAQTNVQQLESKWRETQIKMTRLVGHEVEVPENLKWEGSDLSTQTILTALDHHPQILKAKAEVQASLYKADAIKSSSYPNINWVVSKSSAKDINGDEQAWYTGVNVEWDLFTGGSASASQAAATQRAQATQMQFETTVLELKYRIRSMIQTRDSSFERAEEYRNLSADTDRVRTMFYEQWYYLGKRSLLDVLTAENDHFNNQISAINNQYDGYTANISIMSESAMLLNWLGMPVY
ncbi:TolC family protein [Budviciaceae bacterium BWR-B9]|uniref:TolC family protein n=1 Tax=Limnobaculum allomyrinae TaxID=2791986 RepID=A0ABS1IPN8_9GAMM|nr:MULTISPECIES: TolC family protein [Limnobaculum]MBK5143715.1 TolC family protein [Limnobaculum allomyrinae]MBV7693454.1 TolC family protein [Limnobaculum sp. M2-1]